MSNGELYQEVYVAYTTRNLEDENPPSIKELSQEFGIPIEALRIKIGSGSWDLDRKKARDEFIDRINESKEVSIVKEADTYVKHVESILKDRITTYLKQVKRVDEIVDSFLENEDFNPKEIISLKRLLKSEGDTLMNIINYMKELSSREENGGKITSMEIPNVLSGKGAMITTDDDYDDEDFADGRKTDLFSTLDASKK